MRLITRRTVEAFAAKHPDAEQALADWCATVLSARWRNPQHAKESYGAAARPIGNQRIIFNILRNAYRIVVDVRYADANQGYNGIVRVQFIGTHAEYDRIDATTVSFASPPRRTS